MKLLSTLLVPLILFSAINASAQSPASTPHLKGNLHTHTLWSDGDDYPEMIVEYYKTNGYHFLALSDHNIMLDGEKWVEVKDNPKSKLAFEKYQARFGDKVQTRTQDGKKMVKLATLKELKALFEEPGKFLLIPSEEISAHHEHLPIHINATNIREPIKPRSGTNVLEVMQNNINAVLEQRERTGQPMFPHLNHPNFHFAVKPEELMRVKGERFFEVYNGHPAVFNEGDATRPSTEKMWDIVLAWRLAILHLEPMFGLAVDDSHHYHESKPANSNPGRGWIMVQANELTPESIVHAMEDGQFYATTGVRLKNVKQTSTQLTVQVDPAPDVTYTIEFTGTRGTFAKLDSNHQPTEINEDKIGEVFSREKGTSATYRLKGDELYVRAKVLSSRLQPNSTRTNEVEQAWTQPLIPNQIPHHH